MFNYFLASGITDHNDIIINVDIYVLYDSLFSFVLMSYDVDYGVIKQAGQMKPLLM